MNSLATHLDNVSKLPWYVEFLIAAIFLGLFIWVGINLFKFMLSLFGWKNKSKKNEVVKS